MGGYPKLEVSFSIKIREHFGHQIDNGWLATNKANRTVPVFTRNPIIAHEKTDNKRDNDNAPAYVAGNSNLKQQYNYTN